jgi:hypothetical protein
MLNYSGQAVGPCDMTFTTGRYMVVVAYTSQDSNYGDSQAASVEIDVN